MKKNLLVCTILLMMVIPSLISQELDDLEIQVIPLQKIFQTQYGVLVYYTTSQLTPAPAYLPNAWFFQNSEEENQSVVKATKKSIYQNISTPFMRLIYSNGQLSKVLLIVPKSDVEVGISDYSGPLSDEQLKENFDLQQNATYLLSEENTTQ